MGHVTPMYFETFVKNLHTFFYILMYIIHFHLKCKMIFTFGAKCVKTIYIFPQKAVMSMKFSQFDPRVRFPKNPGKPLKPINGMMNFTILQLGYLSLLLHQRSSLVVRAFVSCLGGPGSIAGRVKLQISNW